ncbi:MAG: Fe-S cluster assembly scaffold SufA [Alphaproteobacteria bacterium RIFCSPLOWO2_01_FULL_45_8]|nr:MAG: Fe-S cluster assembly scaffold SufA [Alphaproteobacteria bacterium GWB1_45_5]OFW76290.1 MAG: Fe-S cluster assembly scaffold SufA [Alphaproteobacteria bacterium GWA1_45_9]OFW89438.1 MAG: Fe-S cluster assembly scaffold SufA [Alphaproteobacteria bacterium RIFCSPHIGHO2_01_FULL_41_14]OFW96419.1 MAG: Fe-S cluster assembly scaffold SufA [Alphaproteobacteria bacterium RIFCSPLOWO2_01_FULL_45_8]HCI48664.1 Fe-S cluster assembly scaffold SufA [Holosporales bacterium]
MNQFPLTVTPAALSHIKVLLRQREKPSVGIRIGIRTRGCSGHAYTLEFLDTENPQDERVTYEDVRIFVDPKATLFVLGTEMDYVEKNFESGFVFKNPNEKGRCGCGESFHV